MKKTILMLLILGLLVMPVHATISTTYHNFVFGTLTSSISDTDNNLYVTAGATSSSWPTTGQFYVVVYVGTSASLSTVREVMMLTYIGAGHYTISSRGLDGTSAHQWPAGAKIQENIIAAQMAEFRDTINNGSGYILFSNVYSGTSTTSLTIGSGGSINVSGTGTVTATILTAPTDTSHDYVRGYKSGTGDGWYSSTTRVVVGDIYQWDFISPVSGQFVCTYIQYAMTDVVFYAMNNDGTSVSVDFRKCGTTNCQTCSTDMLSSNVTSGTTPVAGSMSSTTIAAGEWVKVLLSTNTGAVTSLSTYATGTSQGVK